MFKLAETAFTGTMEDIVKPGLRARATSDGGYTIEGHGKDNILKTTINAIKTIDDDPGNHKKKGLAGLALSALSLGAGTYAMRKIPRVVTSKASPLDAIVALGLPATMYYTANNLDRPKKAILGGTVATASLAHLMSNAKDMPGPVLTNTQRIIQGASLVAPTASFIYGVHELQKADDAKKEVVDRDEVFTRYPLLRIAPWSEKLTNIL